MIDLQGTRKQFLATGRTAAGWARSRGFDPERIRSILRGRYQPTKEEIEALKQDNLWRDAA